jgi:hypothetical protein
MSKLNGDRARFHKNRQSKLRRRQRVRAMLTAFRAQPVIVPALGPQPVAAIEMGEAPGAHGATGEDIGNS